MSVDAIGQAPPDEPASWRIEDTHNNLSNYPKLSDGVGMNRFQKVSSTIVFALGAMATSSAMADTVNFNVSPGFYGGSVSGFTFSDAWRNYGTNDSTLPFAEFYGSPHSVSYDKGEFNFTGMSLSGFPWKNYGYVTGDGNLNIEFRDAKGSVLKTDVVYLPRDNSFVNYTANVNGVHEIYFPATGDVSGPWKEGFWPRLASVSGDGIGNVAPVPEPSEYALMGVGFGAIGLIARRKSKKKAGATPALAAE